MNAASIRRRATSGQLEVEQLLEASRTRSPAVAEEIERLSGQLGWRKKSESVVDGVSYVPLATWAQVVITYIRNGHSGLIALCDQERDLVPFVLPLLETLHDTDSLASVVRIARPAFASPEADRTLSFQLASTLNQLLSFSPNLPIADDAVVGQIRRFLHELIEVAETDAELATAMTALRGVGDESSLAVIDEARALQDPWNGAAGVAKRGIRRRLSKRTSAQ